MLVVEGCGSSNVNDNENASQGGTGSTGGSGGTAGSGGASGAGLRPVVRVPLALAGLRERRAATEWTTETSSLSEQPSDAQVERGYDGAADLFERVADLLIVRLDEFLDDLGRHLWRELRLEFDFARRKRDL